MTRRKGFVSITTLAVLALVAGAIVGGASFISELNTLIQTLFNNSITILFSAMIIGAIIVWIKNSGQPEPRWREDILGFVGLIVLLTAFIVFAPAALGYLGGASADITVTVYNPPLQDPVIQGVSVDNFDEPGPFSVTGNTLRTGAIQISSRTARLAGIGVCDVIVCPSDEVNGQISVTCDGERAGASPYQFSMNIIEDRSKTHTTRATGLDVGEQCEAEIDIGTDSQTRSFGVPGTFN